MRPILRLVFILSLAKFFLCNDFKDEILCDESQNLSIDSILVLSDSLLYLFSGTHFYSLDSTESKDKYRVTGRCNTSDIWQPTYEDLITPIDLSYIDQIFFLINLVNVTNQTYTLLVNYN